MTIGVSKITDSQAEKLLKLSEGHFSDFKSTRIEPNKLTKHLSAFANADGGEIFIGIEDGPLRIWSGYNQPEDANSMLQTIESYFPIGAETNCVFLLNDNYDGLVLKIEVQKSNKIKESSKGEVFLRRGAQSLPIKTGEGLERLRKNKGISSYETEILNLPKEIIENSEPTLSFLVNVVPSAEPEPWLKKQLLLINDKPTVAGVLLFSEEPQAALPKRCGIKIYRYKTKNTVGTRETLDFDPLTIEGCLYNQIFEAIEQSVSVIESVRIHTPEGLESVIYPQEALHEILTNAVLHRDYSIADDIHIRIFDNRVEVQSPGTLPGHVTAQNILEERFSRNPTIVRLLNKFPDPPNKDVGEGLNTAFEAMQKMRLKPPEIKQKENYVLVIIKHELLATPDELILEYLEKNDSIRNKIAREVCHIGSENKIKGILQKMVTSGIIELVPGTTRYTAAYQLKRDK